MPQLHIQVSGPQDPALAGRIAEVASALTASILGKAPEVTAISVSFLPAETWFVAGQSVAAQQRRAYYWQVSVTDETNTKDQKARYLDECHRAMDDLLGGVLEHSYIHVVDARAAAYGYGGRTQEARYQQAGQAAAVQTR